MMDIIEPIFRLLLALILGGLIGWERERHERPAGFRTHILVSLGSTLLMIVSNKMVEVYPEFDPDPARIAAQVVSGIGFLGAGTIIREGFSVKGLTTAASLWAVAAIGLAVGGGFYLVGIITSLMVFITLFFFSRIDFNISSKGKKSLVCRVFDQPGILGKIGVILGSEGININNVNIDKDVNKGELLIKLELNLPKKLTVGLINQKLIKIEELKEISWHDL